MHIALQGPVCHKVGGFWQLIRFDWMYSDSAGLLYLSEFIGP